MDTYKKGSEERRYNERLQQLHQLIISCKESTNNKMSRLEESIQSLRQEVKRISVFCVKEQEKFVNPIAKRNPEIDSKELIGVAAQKMELLHKNKVNMKGVTILEHPFIGPRTTGSESQDQVSHLKSDDLWNSEGKSDTISLKQFLAHREETNAKLKVNEELTAAYEGTPIFDEYPRDNKAEWHCYELPCKALGLEDSFKAKQNSDSSSTDTKMLDCTSIFKPDDKRNLEVTTKLKSQMSKDLTTVVQREELRLQEPIPCSHSYSLDKASCKFSRGHVHTFDPGGYVQNDHSTCVLKMFKARTRNKLLQEFSELRKEDYVAQIVQPAELHDQDIQTNNGETYGVIIKMNQQTVDSMCQTGFDTKNAMDCSQVNVTSATKILTGSLETLQAFNGTTWEDRFLGLWMAALHLVQRERDSIEGPVAHLGTRLSMLLSIISLVLADFGKEDENAPTSAIECRNAKVQSPREHSRDLVCYLQKLGNYEALLIPPESVLSAANQAVSKVLVFVSSINMEDMPISCAGNLHQLIDKACITRSLIDKSAYLWPGYVKGPNDQLFVNIPAQVPGGSSFMNGSTLTPLMIDALVSSPASSSAELKKIYEIAVQGSDDDRISAAAILCGSSLIQGWNIQEHTVYFITKLPCPPVPTNNSRTESHLIHYAPMLNVLLVGMASVDCVQIFFLHGVIPQLAGSLMPICEVFGSGVPDVMRTLTSGEEISAYEVFSKTFALLLKLWRFTSPPIQHEVRDVPPVESQPTPEYHKGSRKSATIYIFDPGGYLIILMQGRFNLDHHEDMVCFKGEGLLGFLRLGMQGGVAEVFMQNVGPQNDCAVHM